MVKKILGVVAGISLVAILVFSVGALVTPAPVEADVSIAYGAINNPYGGACGVSLPRNLSLGSRGDDVATLQAYIAGLRYPGSGEGMITGYYGETTQTVIATLQRERGLPITGDVDSATRAHLAVNCGPTSYTVPQPYYPHPPQATQVVYQYVYQYQYPCPTYFGAPCTPPEPPPSPATITDISGPSTITVNQPGSWVVDVAAPNANTNSTLSVTWGDSNYYSGVPPVTHTIYGNQTFTFSHTFKSYGVHYVTFTVTDGLGKKNSQTFLVTVIERNYPFR